MSRLKLRESIAREAARLIVRGKEKDFVTARKRAARWLSRRRLQADDLPSNAEIQSQVYALAGLFSDEHQAEALHGMRRTALELMNLLRDFQPRLFGSAVDGPAMPGSEITLQATADSPAPVVRALTEAGLSPRLASAENGDGSADEVTPPVGCLRFTHRFPCEVIVAAPGTAAAGPATPGFHADHPAARGIDAAELRRLLDEADRAIPDLPEADDEEPAADEHEYHPDAFAVMRMLLARLESVRLDPARHPEGDALYHSLQVFELGRQARPWDEEFLLACLLHDVGLGLDRRRPVQAALDALGELLTERTCFLIEHRREAVDYLKTGRVSRSLRRSEDFDDLVLLARCDLDGRVPGAQVETLDQALEYVAGLGTAWDDV